MIIGEVRGSVVSTSKAETLQGLKLLVVMPLDTETLKEKGGPLVAIDAVGAGEGEVVLCVGGSSSRQTAFTDGKPCDLAIIAIIDSIDIRGKRVFEKYAEK
jgi:ethanolamine utilization protein EutN/carbon dioxide concentrating mechanism protein CcmL